MDEPTGLKIGCVLVVGSTAQSSLEKKSPSDVHIISPSAGRGSGRRIRRGWRFQLATGASTVDRGHDGGDGMLELDGYWKVGHIFGRVERGGPALVDAEKKFVRTLSNPHANKSNRGFRRAPIRHRPSRQPPSFEKPAHDQLSATACSPIDLLKLMPATEYM